MVITRDGNQGVGLATIEGGSSLSDAVDLLETRTVAFQLPSSINGATSLTFQASADGVTYSNVHESDGDELTYTVAASRFVRVADMLDFAGVRYLKVRTGTSGAATAQAAGCVIKVIAQVL